MIYYDTSATASIVRQGLSPLKYGASSFLPSRSLPLSIVLLLVRLPTNVIPFMLVMVSHGYCPCLLLWPMTKSDSCCADFNLQTMRISSNKLWELHADWKQCKPDGCHIQHIWISNIKYLMKDKQYKKVSFPGDLGEAMLCNVFNSTETVTFRGLYGSSVCVHV